jgi:hypothetical protein
MLRGKGRVVYDQNNLSAVPQGHRTRRHSGSGPTGFASRDKATISLSIDVGDIPTPDRDDRADLIVEVTEHLPTEVKRGENQGRTLAQAAVVREMETVAGVTTPNLSSRATFAIAADWRRENLKIISFVQQRRKRS